MSVPQGLFPDGPWPYRLPSRGGTALVALVGFLLCWSVAGVLFYFNLMDVPTIGNDAELWESGAVSPRASIKGHVLTKGFFVGGTVDLTVRYEADGKIYEGDIKHWLLFDRFDEDLDPEVHYDPDDPTRFVLGGTVDVSGGRWRFKAAIAIFVLIIAGLPFAFVVADLADRKFYAVCSQNPEPVALPLVGAPTFETDSDGKATNRMRYTFRAGPRTRSASFDNADLPLYLDEGTILGVRPRGARGRIDVLKASLVPFAFDDEERSAIQQRILQHRMAVSKRSDG